MKKSFQNWYSADNLQVNFVTCMLILSIIFGLIVLQYLGERSQKSVLCKNIGLVYVERLDGCFPVMRPWDDK